MTPELITKCEETEEGLEALRALRHEIAAQWESVHLDLATIKIDASVLDAKNYHGNTISIGNRYTRQEIMLARWRSRRGLG